MKNKSYLTGLLAFIAIVFLTACGKEVPTPNLVQERIIFLKKNNTSWSQGTDGKVMKDGYDVSHQFTDFELKFSDNSFSTNNGVSSAWPSSGTWTFENENPNLIRRSDDVLITLTVEGEQLTLKFSVSDVLGSSLERVDGEFTFTLE